MSNPRIFAPKPYGIRQATDNKKRHGVTLNPPRFPEIGGMTTKNAQQVQSDLVLKKPGGTRG